MKIDPYQLCETLKSVFFRTEWPLLICPVNGGLTYKTLKLPKLSISEISAVPAWNPINNAYGLFAIN